MTVDPEAMKAGLELAAIAAARKEVLLMGTTIGEAVARVAKKRGAIEPRSFVDAVIEGLRRVPSEHTADLVGQAEQLLRRVLAQPRIEQIAEMIDGDRLKDAKEVLRTLEVELGPLDAEVVRLRGLIDLMEVPAT